MDQLDASANSKQSQSLNFTNLSLSLSPLPARSLPPFFPYSALYPSSIPPLPRSCPPLPPLPPPPRYVGLREVSANSSLVIDTVAPGLGELLAGEGLVQVRGGGDMQGALG